MNQVVLSWLVAFAFGSVILSALALILLRFLSSASASTRFLVAQSATTGLLVLAVLLAFMPGYILFPSLSQTGVLAGKADPTDKNRRSLQPTNARSATEIERQESTAEGRMAEDLGHSGKLPVALMLPATPTIQESSLHTINSGERDSYDQLLIAVWLFGSAVFSLRFISFSVSAHRICSRASSDVPPSLTSALSMASLQFNRDVNPIRILVTDEMPIPFTTGVFRPTIVLPVDSKNWPFSKIQIVMQHELAHIQRRDVLLGWINLLACSLAWFNPLVWILGSRCNVEREHACDDQVLNSGVDATDYGACLFEIGASLAGRSIHARGAIAISEPPLKRRLAMILSPKVNRSSVPTRNANLLVCATIIAVLVISSFRPIGGGAIATQTELPIAPPAQRLDNQEPIPKANNGVANSKPIEIPKMVLGKITGSDGQPIAGASLHLKWAQRIETPDSDAIETVDLQEWRLQTDANGDYSVDTSSMANMKDGQWLQLWGVSANGFVFRREIWLNATELSAGKHLDAKLLQGRKVTAQIVDSNGAPLPGATVKAAGNDGDPNKAWWSRGDTADAGGKCSMDVPVGMDIEWIVYGKEHAPKRVYVGRNDSDLGTIQLTKGTKVYGQVLDEAGRAVSGTVVQISMQEGCKLQSMAFGAEFATVTDTNGKYSLRPFLGKCTISTRSVGHDESNLGRTIIKGEKGLLMLPIELSLDSKDRSTEVDLRQGPTALIQGVARWDSGSPVTGMNIKGGAMFTHTGVDLSETKTDSDGRYELRLPVPLENAYVRATGEKNTSGVFYMAHGDAPAPAIGQTQFITFRPLERDVKQANWTLKRYEPAALRMPNKSDGDKALEELQQQQSQMVQDISKALQQAKSPQELAEVNKLDPRNHFASKYLDLEEKYRGSKAALNALKDAMNNARSIGDENSAASLGRIEAVDRLIEHYIKHEELAQTFRTLSGGPDVPRALEFLEMAYDLNPHRGVKMAALVAQIEMAKSHLRFFDSVAENKRAMAALQSRIAAFRNFDPARLRDDTNKKLDILETQYSSEPIQYYGDGSSAAASLRNAINNIAVGHAVSQIDAMDVNNKAFRLSEQAGKVVLLLFASDVSDDYATRYEPFRDFIAKYWNKNVVVVGVMIHDKQEPLVAAAKQGFLPWTVLPQSQSSKIMRDWGVDALPSIFIVDQKGVLQGTYLVSANPMTGYSQIEEAIDRLLSGAEVQPSK